MTESSSQAPNVASVLRETTTGGEEELDEPPNRVVERIKTKDVEQGAVEKKAKHRPKRPLHRKALRKVRRLFQSQKTWPGPAPTYLQSFLSTIRYTPLNVCLLFIPVSWALYFTHQKAIVVFVTSALGIVPLAALLGFGTEQIALHTSSSVGGLMNATLGNIVEMIIAGIALKKCDLELVQSSLLGGLLSNLLLVTGMAFIVGGFKFHQQEFQPMVAQLNSSLMTVSVISLIVPAAFHEFLGDRLDPGEELGVLLQLSRGSAVILILMYVAYLFFQFYSHNHLFLDTIQNSSYSSHTDSEDQLPGITRRSTSVYTSSSSSSESSASSISSISVESPKLNVPFSIILLTITTILAFVTAEHLVDSLTEFTASSDSISKEWLTLILIPVISNAAEHTTAVLVARKGKFDLAMAVAIGSCIQIALFVIPLLVLVGWIMGKPLTLYFDGLETVVLFFSVLLVKFSVEDGKAHWMSGFVLIGVYLMIALSFWNFPETPRIVQGVPLTCT
ncbi:Sodium/calcium exchanger protein-domain-containing protein [Mycena floridula]|nr:Sodium/calcium exchanger protein-domain-containing protein [Mycena floridula]